MRLLSKALTGIGRLSVLGDCLDQDLQDKMQF